MKKRSLVKSSNKNKGDVFYVLLMFSLMLVINYAMSAFGASAYSNSGKLFWPDLYNLRYIVFVQFLLIAPGFLFSRYRVYITALLTVHFILLIILLAIYLTTGTFYCEEILNLIYDTTWEEIKGFAIAYISFKAFFILVLTVVLYCIVLVWINKSFVSKGGQKRRNIIVFCAVMLLATVPPSIFYLFKAIRSPINVKATLAQFCDTYPLYCFYFTIKRCNASNAKFIKDMRHRQVPDTAFLNIPKGSATPLGIFVIGESATRSHLSIYGYHRDTTPNLLRYRDNIFAFDDVITVLPTTIVALKFWLTDMTLKEQTLKWTLFDVLKKAGYTIDVISNQNKSGWSGCPTHIIFATADSVDYTDEKMSSEYSRVYDEALLPLFDSWLEITLSDETQQGASMLFLHLKGSHEPFFCRYPGEFKSPFLNDSSHTNLQNEYDTSLLYMDMILGKILDSLSVIQERPVFLIYISDHGAVVDAKTLRTPNSTQNSAYEVPLLMWINHAYRDCFPETVNRMEAQKHIALQADRAHYGLLEMMGVSIPEVPTSESFLSADFIELPRTTHKGRHPYVKE